MSESGKRTLLTTAQVAACASLNNDWVWRRLFRSREDAEGAVAAQTALDRVDPDYMFHVRGSQEFCGVRTRDPQRFPYATGLAVPGVPAVDCREYFDSFGPRVKVAAIVRACRWLFYGFARMAEVGLVVHVPELEDLFLTELSSKGCFRASNMSRATFIPPDPRFVWAFYNDAAQRILAGLLAAYGAEVPAQLFDYRLPVPYEKRYHMAGLLLRYAGSGLS